MKNPSMLKWKEGVSAERSVVPFYKISRYHIPEERNVSIHRLRNKSILIIFIDEIYLNNEGLCFQKAHCITVPNLGREF